MLRLSINEAHTNHYFSKGEVENNRVAYYMLSLVTKIDDLMRLMKKCAKKEKREKK